MKRSFKFAAMTMMALALCVTSLTAAGSVSKNGAVSEEIVINGKKVDKGSVKATFKTDFSNEKLAPTVSKAIAALNESPAKLVEVLKSEKIVLPTNDGVKLENVSMLTGVQNLELIDAKTGEVIKDAKNVQMTWEVPNLTKNVGVVRVLHFSTTRNTWEMLIPDTVNYETKTVTTTFPDLSPVAVVYVPKDKVDSIGNIADYGDGSKPQDIIKDTANASSTDTNFALYAAGFVVLAAGAYAVRRKVKA